MFPSHPGAPQTPDGPQTPDPLGLGGVGGMPAAEFDVTEDLVRALLHEQHLDLADLPLTLVANGWDNAVYRLGDDLVARMPRRQLGADRVEHEQRWLPELARWLPLPIPAPVHNGRPGAGYPWSWSICSWFDGEVAADVAQRFERMGTHLLAAALGPDRSGVCVRPVRTQTP